MLYKEAQQIFDTVMGQMEYLYAPQRTKQAGLSSIPESVAKWLVEKNPTVLKEYLAKHMAGTTPVHNLYYALGAGAGLGAAGYGAGRWHEGAKNDWDKLKYGLGGYGAGLATPYAYNMLTGKGTGAISSLAQRLMPGLHSGQGGAGQAENLPFSDFTSL